MAVFKSAKSRLIWPGRTTKSKILRTAFSRTSSAFLYASFIEISRKTFNRRWFGMMINESTCCSRASMPFSADCKRRLPSKLNGVVTTPTVRIPISFAISATTGAAPVPVPPPIPAVTKTISVPSSCWRISSRLSSAAVWPTCGFAPAPRPRVLCSPSWILNSASIRSNACLSVLAQTNFTPWISDCNICCTALPPAPPTPNTVKRAWPLLSLWSSSKNSNEAMTYKIPNS